MIPLLAIIIIANNRTSKNLIILWFAPVILIPLIWPGYTLTTGHFNDWLNGVLYQIERETDKTLVSFNNSHL